MSGRWVSWRCDCKPRCGFSALVHRVVRRKSSRGGHGSDRNFILEKEVELDLREGRDNYDYCDGKLSCMRVILWHFWSIKVLLAGPLSCYCGKEEVLLKWGIWCFGMPVVVPKLYY